MPTFKERVDQHDREIGAIRKLIHAGMKLLAKSDANLLRLEEDQKVARKEMRELRAAQRETAKELQTFIRSLRGGGNGHVKHRID